MPEQATAREIIPLRIHPLEFPQVTPLMGMFRVKVDENDFQPTKYNA